MTKYLDRDFDVCIRGGGIAGCCLALLLAKQNLRIGLQAKQPSGNDVRAYSLNAASHALLKSVDVWPEPNFATPVKGIEVWGDGGGEIGFFNSRGFALTWMVDVAELERLLWQAVISSSQIKILNEPVRPALTIICEGKYSRSVSELHLEQDIWPYGQHAVAGRLQHGLQHQQIARQWFFNKPSGLEIVALLPLDGEGGSSSSLVWSVPTGLSEQLIHLSENDFTAELSKRIGPILGDLHLTSERAVWPLQLARVRQWCGEYDSSHAWLLAGDAAHRIHPLAGLGLNLGLEDVGCIAKMLAIQQEQSFWRGLNDARLLRSYERERKARMLPVWWACDGLQRLFDHPSPAVRWLRNQGLSGLNRFNPAKNWLMQLAMNSRSGYEFD